MDRGAWWDTLDQNWYNILVILQRYTHQKGIAEKALQAKEARNWKTLYLYMHKAWDNAPDSINKTFIPGWYVMCDLLSEVDEG